MNAEREVLYTSLLATQVENPDLGIGDTSTETRFRVRFVLAVPIAVDEKEIIRFIPLTRHILHSPASRTATHLDSTNLKKYK